MKNAFLTIRLPEKDRKDFAKHCARHSAVPAEMVRRLMRDYVAGYITYPSQPPKGE